MKTCGQCKHYSPAAMMCAWRPRDPEPCWAFGAYAELQRRRSDRYQADGCSAFVVIGEDCGVDAKKGKE